MRNRGDKTGTNNHVFFSKGCVACPQCPLEQDISYVVENPWIWRVARTLWFTASPTASQATHEQSRGPPVSGTSSPMPKKKGRHRAKPVCEACGLSSENREHAKRRKINQTAAATATAALRRAEALLAEREVAVAAAEEKMQAEIAKMKAEIDLAKEKNLLEQKRLESWRDSIAKKAAAQAAKEAQRVAKAAEREQVRLTRAFSDFSTEVPTAVELDFLAQQEELKHARGSICTEAQSRCILLLLISLVNDDGLTQTAAIEQVCEALWAPFFEFECTV